MTAEIKDYITKCEVCATYQIEQITEEPLIFHKILNRPWEIVGSDIFHFHGKDYLCTMYYYSNYFEVDSLKDKAATEVIQVLKREFARHGIPNWQGSDNGPPFNSFVSQHFAESNDMEHVTSSLHYPQSNGKVKNSVKTAKNLLKKSKAAGSDIYFALLEWRNTFSEGLAHEVSSTKVVQSLNSPFFPPHIGAEPGRAKRESSACSEHHHFFRPNWGKTIFGSMFQIGLVARFSEK